jgi:hypothetical protein
MESIKFLMPYALCLSRLTFGVLFSEPTRKSTQIPFMFVMPTV